MTRRVPIYLIRVYQKYFSPLLGRNCRFVPTCSEYCIQSISKYGFLKGLFFGFLRICRCHPLHPGGYDPVKISNNN